MMRESNIDGPTTAPQRTVEGLSAPSGLQPSMDDVAPPLPSSAADGSDPPAAGHSSRRVTRRRRAN